PEMEVGAPERGIDLDRPPEVRHGEREVAPLEREEALAREAGREAPRGARHAAEVARRSRPVAQIPVAVRAVVEHLDEDLALGEVAEVEAAVDVLLRETVALDVVAVGE